MFKNEFIGGVEEVKNVTKNYSDIVVCKLKRSFFKFKHDIFLINAYISPEGSAINGRDTLIKVESIVSDLQGKGEIILYMATLM